MVLLVQDRDFLIDYVQGDVIYTESKTVDGVAMGINLYIYTGLGIYLLGTFDSVNDAVEEINRISNCNSEYYAVTGYSEYE